MDGADRRKSTAALVMMANFFRIEGDETGIYEKSVNLHYFTKVCAVLYKTHSFSVEEVKSCLWGLSNMVAESKKITVEFFRSK